MQYQLVAKCSLLKVEITRALNNLEPAPNLYESDLLKQSYFHR